MEMELKISTWYQQFMEITSKTSIGTNNFICSLCTNNFRVMVSQQAHLHIVYPLHEYMTELCATPPPHLFPHTYSEDVIIDRQRPAPCKHDMLLGVPKGAHVRLYFWPIFHDLLKNLYSFHASTNDQRYSRSLCRF